MPPDEMAEGQWREGSLIATFVREPPVRVLLPAARPARSYSYALMARVARQDGPEGRGAVRCSPGRTLGSDAVRAGRGWDGRQGAGAAGAGRSLHGRA